MTTGGHQSLARATVRPGGVAQKVAGVSCAASHLEPGGDEPAPLPGRRNDPTRHPDANSLTTLRLTKLGRLRDNIDDGLGGATIMQAALRLTTTVRPGGRVEVVDPQFPSGEDVDVIVLFPQAASTGRRSIWKSWRKHRANSSSIRRLTATPACARSATRGSADPPASGIVYPATVCSASSASSASSRRRCWRTGNQFHTGSGRPMDARGKPRATSEEAPGRRRRHPRRCSAPSRQTPEPSLPPGAADG